MHKVFEVHIGEFQCEKCGEIFKTEKVEDTWYFTEGRFSVFNLDECPNGCKAD